LINEDKGVSASCKNGFCIGYRRFWIIKLMDAYSFFSYVLEGFIDV